MLHLFHHLSSSLLSIVLCYHGGQAVHIQSVLPGKHGNTYTFSMSCSYRQVLRECKVEGVDVRSASESANRPAELEVGSFDKLEFIQRHTDALQHGLDDLLVVFDPELQQLPGSFHVV